MECVNCGKNSEIHSAFPNINYICTKCFFSTEKSKELVLIKMMSHQSGKGRVTTEEDILELIKKEINNILTHYFTILIVIRILNELCNGIKSFRLQFLD